MSDIISLNAISRTMFAYDMSDPNSSISTLLKSISDGPDGEDTTLARAAMLIIGAFPRLQSLPNRMKSRAAKFHTELSNIAESVWGSVETIGTLEGMDARALEVLSTQILFAE